MDNLLRFLVTVLTTVMWFLLFNTVLGTYQSADAIWSGKGFMVIFMIATVIVSHYIWTNNLKVTLNLIGKFFLVMAVVYVFGILIGATVLKVCGYETTVTPIWSGTGIVMCIWCAFISRMSCSLLKVDKKNKKTL